MQERDVGRGWHRWVFGAVLLTTVGCGDGRAAMDAGDRLDAGGLDASAALEDAGAPLDAGAEDAGVTSPGCALFVTSSPRTECDEACDARLLLVSGDSWCSFQCTATTECEARGAGLVCVAEIGGACVPSCTSDADCPPGFYRCDPTGGFCDTYPVEG